MSQRIVLSELTPFKLGAPPPAELGRFPVSFEFTESLELQRFIGANMLKLQECCDRAAAAQEDLDVEYAASVGGLVSAMALKKAVSEVGIWNELNNRQEFDDVITQGYLEDNKE